MTERRAVEMPTEKKLEKVTAWAITATMTSIVVATMLTFFIYVSSKGKERKEEFWIAFQGCQEIHTPFGRKELIVSADSLLDGTCLLFPISTASSVEAEKLKKYFDGLKKGEKIMVIFSEWRFQDWTWSSLAIKQTCASK